MRYLLTHCPRCRAQFYVTEDKKVSEKVEATCPHCNLHYKDIWDPYRIKEAKYQWELYSGLYFPVKFSKGNELHLKIGGLLLFSTLFLFTIGILSVFFTESFSAPSQGVGLGGMIFSLFVVIGAVNAYKRKSFVISLVGSIFAILSSVLWGGLNISNDFIFFRNSLSLLYLFLCLALSFLALMLIVRNREKFDFGY